MVNLIEWLKVGTQRIDIQLPARSHILEHSGDYNPDARDNESQAVLGVSSRYCCAIVVFLTVFSVAIKAIAYHKIAPVFKIKPGPPAGFAALAKDPFQKTYIAVFYQGEFLTNALAKFNQKNITFIHPKRLMEAIKGINPKSRSIVLKALSQTLSSHSSSLCPYGSSKPFCRMIHPKVVGVIVNALNYRADIFVNAKLIDLKKLNTHTLGHSSAGFSFLTQNDVQATKVDNYKGDTLTDTSIIASGNEKLKVQMGYTTSQFEGQRSHNFNLGEISASRYSDGVLYRGGLVAEATGEFFNTSGLAGVDVRNYGIFTDLAQSVKGSPLMVYLALPSTVVVKRKGQILSAQTLPAGKQEINTRNFPIGSYDVTIQTTNRLGQTVNETRFFVKQESLPQYGNHHYDVAFGVLQKETFNSIQNEFITHPNFENVPIFSYHDMRKVAKATGLSSTFISSGARSYLSEVLHFYRNELDIAPGLMISSKLDRGALMNVQYTGKHTDLSLQATRIWRNMRFNNRFQDINLTSNTFYPVLANRTQIQGNISLFDKGNQLNIGGGEYDDFKGQRSGTTNVSYTRMVYANELGYLQVNASLTHENQDDIGLMSLSYNFSTAHVNGSAVLHYSNQNADLAGTHQYNSGAALSLNKSFIFDVNKTLSVSGSADLERHSRSQSIRLNFTVPSAEGTVSMSHYHYGSGYGNNNTQYAANVQSAIAYAGGHWSMGYGRGLSSGAMVMVSSQKPVRYDLYDNHQYLGEYQTNLAYPIFVTPYQVHRFTIQPMGADIYTYNHNPKETILYAGNVQYLHWLLQKQYILFAQIVNPSHQPIPNLLLNNRGEYDTTGPSGYVQASLVHTQKKLTFTNINGQVCYVRLPKHIQIVKGVAVLNKPLVCR